LDSSDDCGFPITETAKSLKAAKFAKKKKRALNLVLRALFAYEICAAEISLRLPNKVLSTKFKARFFHLGADHLT